MLAAFVSGGKDSYFAIYRYGRRPDVGLMLVYDFPRPSPHLLNLGKSVETLLLAGVPVYVARLSRGREFAETVEILRRLGVDAVIAGDVYLEEHLNYMERLAREAGVTLVEPLWGLDPLELLHEEFEAGVRSVVIGCVSGLRRWLGAEISRENVGEFAEDAAKAGLDPLGERGEYHTLVVWGPLHSSPLGYRAVEVLDVGDYAILRLV